MLRYGARWTGVVLLCLSAAPAAAGPSLDKLLESPLSPGIVGLLTASRDDPRVQERLREGLVSENADIRATAARAVGLIEAVGLEASLRKALEKETDLFAAREQMRALAALEGKSAYDPIRAGSDRLGADAWQVFADIIVLQEGTLGLMEHLDRLHEAHPTFPFAPFVARALSRPTLTVDQMAARIMDAGNRRAWHDLLTAAFEQNIPLDPNTLHSGLVHPRLEIAGETAWHLVRSQDQRIFGSPRKWMEAVQSVESRSSEAPDEEGSYGLELLARVLGRQRATRTGIALFSLDAPSHIDEFGMDASAAPYLSMHEVEVLEERFERRFKHRAFTVRQMSPVEKQVEKRVIRTASDFPRGFVKDLLEVTECKVRRDMTVFQAGIVYDAVGRPRNVRHGENTRGEECQLFAATLFAMSLSPPMHFPNPDREERLVFFLAPDAIRAFQETRFHHWPGTLTELNEIVPPKRTRFVQPEYPRGNLQRRMEGKVILSVVISAGGVVSSMRVLDLTNDHFLLSAMRAVGEWRYKPARFEDDSVAVGLVVIVEFNIKRSP